MYNLDHVLQFVASTTICPSDIRKLREHITRAKVDIDPLDRMLITPYFAAPGSLRIAREMAEEGREVVFDSGGYYVQIGRLRYEELYMPLLQTYFYNRSCKTKCGCGYLTGKRARQRHGFHKRGELENGIFKFYGTLWALFQTV